jgi:hypothetical protein
VIATGFEGGKRKQESLQFDESSSAVPTFEPISEDELDIPAFLKKR